MAKYKYKLTATEQTHEKLWKKSDILRRKLILFCKSSFCAYVQLGKKYHFRKLPLTLNCLLKHSK